VSRISHVLSVFAHRATIYLHCCPGSISFHLAGFPYQIWVSRLWGLPRSTPSVSQRLRHCGTFTGFLHGFHFRSHRSRQYYCQDLFFHPAQSLHSSQSVRAWTFLCLRSGCPGVTYLSLIRCFRVWPDVSRDQHCWLPGLFR